jgi:hypothetical protein
LLLLSDSNVATLSCSCRLKVPKARTSSAST